MIFLFTVNKKITCRGATEIHIVEKSSDFEVDSRVQMLVKALIATIQHNDLRCRNGEICVLAVLFEKLRNTYPGRQPNKQFPS